MGFWRRVRLALLIILKQRFLLGWWCKPEGWKTIKLMSEKEYDALPKILEWYDD